MKPSVVYFPKYLTIYIYMKRKGFRKKDCGKSISSFAQAYSILGERVDSCKTDVWKRLTSGRKQWCRFSSNPLKEFCILCLMRLLYRFLEVTNSSCRWLLIVSTYNTLEMVAILASVEPAQLPHRWQQA